MATLAREDILKLARLCQLELSDDEVEQFSKEISTILDYVEQLQKVDVKGLEPTSQVTGLTNVMRDDVTLNYDAQPDDLLKSVPAVDKRQVKVKRIIT